MIYLSVRSSPDWQNEPAFWAQLPSPMRQPVELWNETFQLPYHVFRHELKELARSNWSQLPGVAVLPYEEVPEGELVLPSDDDDWFSPRVGPTLEGARQPGIVLYRWPGRYLEFAPTLRYQLGILRRRWLPRTPPTRGGTCSTNGYAFQKGSVGRDVFRSHVLAGRWRAAHPERCRELEHPLSGMNRSLGSQTVLARELPLSRSSLLAKYEKSLRVYRRPLPPELGWAAPYVARMLALTTELLPRSRRVTARSLAAH